MMREPSLFVSSTCYDLRQVREDIKGFVEGLGLKPVLSEHNSFPVNPDLATVDNCLKVVEQNADIFVLIVGSRHGSTGRNDRSVTNLEYLTARSKGIPVFVFVSRSVLDILPVWKANKGGDYSGITDSPKLFEFVASLEDSGSAWVFPFDTAQQIFDTLRLQLSYLFMDSLALRLQLSGGGLPPSVRELPGAQMRLIIERPPHWEYLLFSEALTHAITALADAKRDWHYGIAFGRSTIMDPRAFTKWVEAKLEGVSRLIASANQIIKEALPTAFGPLGTSGDAEAILYCARRLAEVYKGALEWRSDFVRTGVRKELDQLKAAAAGFCDNMVREIEEFGPLVNRELKQALLDAQSGKKVDAVITLTLTGCGMAEITTEADRLKALIISGELSWD
ncbi:MAG: DUF4062 domain-containing protein [Bryobacteraceae bacterium]